MRSLICHSVRTLCAVHSDNISSEQCPLVAAFLSMCLQHHKLFSINWLRLNKTPTHKIRHLSLLMPRSHQKRPSATRPAFLELFLTLLTFLIKLPAVERSGRCCSRRLIPLTPRLRQRCSTYGVNYFLSTAVAPQGGHLYCVHNDQSNTQNYKY